MRIAGFSRYDLQNNPGDNGPAFTIWFAGCPFACKGCHNPDLQDARNGKEYTPMEIFYEMDKQDLNYGSVVLLGGEPLVQHFQELGELFGILMGMGKKIWLYTGFKFDEIPSYVLDKCYFVKAGQYVELLATNSFPASSNQEVYRRVAGVLVREGTDHADRDVTETGIRNTIPGMGEGQDAK